MKNIFKKIGILLLALGIFFCFNINTVNAIVNNNINNSWLRLDKDGVDEYSRVASPSFASNNVGAFAVWVNFDTIPTSGLDNIAGFGDDDGGSVRSLNFLIWFDTTRVTWGNYYRDASGTPYGTQADASITAGTRYLLGIQSNGSTTSYYINGVLQTTQTRFGTDTGGWFADNNSGGTRYFSFGNVFRSNAWALTMFDGKADSPMIFNRVLTSTEWTNLYNGGVPVPPDTVVELSAIPAYWQLGEPENGSGSIATFYDVIGGNHLTTFNMETADIISSNYY